MFDKIGIAKTYFSYSSSDNIGLSLYFGGYDSVYSGSGCNYVGDSISDNDDGSQNVYLQYIHCGFHSNCLDWSERSECTLLSTGGVVGHFRGKSNANRTRYDFDVEWIDCNDLLLDSGTLTLWQE